MTRSKGARRAASRSPVPRTQLALPGGLLLGAVIALAFGYAGVAVGLFFGSLGVWLGVVGRHRRWKGAPEAGYVLIGVGVLVILAALFT